MATLKKKLKLSDDRLVAGVLGGFAEYFHIDVTLLRVLFVAFVLFTGLFPGVVLYAIAYFIMKDSE